MSESTNIRTAGTTESFADLFAASLQYLDMQNGSIVTGTITAIDSDWVTVDAGLKSEERISQ
jgi:small subunit ribosomal protein S1